MVEGVEISQETSPFILRNGPIRWRGELPKGLASRGLAIKSSGPIEWKARSFSRYSSTGYVIKYGETVRQRLRCFKVTAYGMISVCDDIGGEVYGIAAAIIAQ